MLLETMGEQIIDPFRIGMLFFLVMTARNTVRATGTWIPLAAGILFVAVIIPLTFSPNESNFWPQVVTGLATNVMIVAAVLLVFLAIDRFSPPANER